MTKKISSWHLIIFMGVMTLPLLIDAVLRQNLRYFFAYIISIVIAFSIRYIINLKAFTFVVLSFPVLLLALAFDLLVIEYKSYINVSAWQIFFETNQSETLEFFSGLKILTKFIMFVQITTYLFYLKFTWKKNIDRIGVKKRNIILVLILLLAIDYLAKGATRIAFPLRSIESLYTYVSAKITEAKFIEMKKQKELHAQRNKEFAHASGFETIVIIVGESLRRDHLGYYGYKRNTTPYLDKEDLILFEDVVSPANQTINSLMRIFTPAEYLNVSAFWKNPSFIKAFHETGFQTYWITNQKIYGKHDSKASFIGQETDEFIAHPKMKYQYDEVLLPELDKILKDKYNKKLIFLHLLGNHALYKKRHPESFTYFSKKKEENKQKRLINWYDDAVLYNDYFLHLVLEKLKNIDGEKTFIMFSDHGESLYDTPFFPYHGSAIPSQSEYNIPLVLWFSDEFKKHHVQLISELKDNTAKPVIFSDAYYSIPHLFGITFDNQIPEKNFFSKNYHPPKQRKVINLNLELLDYDKLLPPKNHNDLIK